MMPFEKLYMISCFFSLDVMQSSILPFANQIIRPGIEFLYSILIVKILLSVLGMIVIESVKKITNKFRGKI